MKARVDSDNFDAYPSYNDWLDDRYTSENGPLDLSGFKPRPSYVLHQLSFDTYEAGLADYLSERQEHLKETVFTEFPTPIDYYYYRFESGYENELKRLYFLRDAWEAIVDVVHALTVSECRYRQIHLPDPIRFQDLLSDSIDQRLLTIERVLAHAKANNIKLETEVMVDATVLPEIRELNRTRNAFSHSAAQSEKQAREWIGECYEEMGDVLAKITGLTKITVARYIGHTDADTLRCEIFKGHSLTRTIESISISQEQARLSAACFYKQRLFVAYPGHLFGLQPLLHLREDPSGHTTKILAFRKTRGDAPNRTLEFEVIGEASRTDINRSEFCRELNELRALFGLDAE
jgi:hypothetical protein